MFVVVGNVLAKDCMKVTTPEDEHPVKALGTNRAYKAFSDRVRPGRADRCPYDLGAQRRENFVEVSSELRVPVPDKELDR